MDQGLKERLVGAAVLVAIAVWLIPWVLDGPEAGVEPNVSSLQLPAAEEPMPMRTQTLRLGDAAEADETAKPAAVTETAAAAPEPADETPADSSAERHSTDAETTVAAALPAAEAPKPTPPAETRAAPAPPKPSAAAATAASGDWTVQLGVFGEEANARRVAQRAGTFGYKAEVSSYRNDSGKMMYRVRVGPQATRSAADAAASALRAHGVEARVVAR